MRIVDSFPRVVFQSLNFLFLKMDKSTSRSSLPSVSVEGQFRARQWEEHERLELLAAKSNFVSALGD